MTAPLLVRPGVWLVASAALGRPVTAAENPHICGVTLTATRSGNAYRYAKRDCPACPPRTPGGER
ncbi:hypothetical protein ACQEUV_00115 [Micromonospora aurantiaca (nom. illeg.)]|uniref:hypothetical protein n=1 Tax=Micromonospora aurantiaca (nom. illeg.) TaxID=47850 RepID=UPI003DA4695A